MHAVERIDIDDTKDRLQAVMHRARYDFALERIPPAAKVLEIGTGAGGMTVQLVRKCPDYTGLEFDSAAIEMTRAKLQCDAKIIEGDARALPFPEDAFSHIVCLEVIEHLGDWLAGVNEIARCLHSRGVAMVSVPYRKHGGPSALNPYHPYEPAEKEIAEAFRQRFENVEVFSQYFAESIFETLARNLHLRRLFGLHRIYDAMTKGEPDAMKRLSIGAHPRGWKLGVILVASNPRKAALSGQTPP